MNKKFSTLMAGLVLASGVATAQHAPSAGGFPYRTQATKSVAVGSNINQIQNMNRWYQLTDGAGNVLVQVRDQRTGALTLKMEAATALPTSAALNASLWKIKVTTHATTAATTFTYINKETNLELVLDHTKAVKFDAATSIAGAPATARPATILDGCTEKWGWYSSDVNPTPFTAEAIYSHFAGTDSVMVMQLNAASEVVATKYSKAVAGTGLTGLAAANVLAVKPVIAGGIQLTARDINQMIDAQLVDATTRDSATFKFNTPNGKLNSELQDIFNNTLASSKYEAQNAVLFQQFGFLGLNATATDLATAKTALDIVKLALDAVTAKGDAALGSTATATAATAADAAATAANNAVGIATTAATAALTAADAGVAAGTAFTNAATALTAANAALTVAKTALEAAATAIELSTTATADVSFSSAARVAAANAVAAATKATAAATKATTGATESPLVAGATTYDLYNIRLTTPRVLPTSADKYFMVDTTRYQEEQIPSLSPAYKLSNKEIKNIDATGAYLLARYFFKVTYYPSNDSLFIEPLNAASKTDAEARVAGTPWLNTIAGSQWVADADDTAANNGITVSNSTTTTPATNGPISLTTTVLTSTGKTIATVGSPNTVSGFDTRISFVHEYPYFVRTSFVPGAYYAKLVTKQHAVSSTNRADGQYLVANMNGTIVYDEWASTQNFEHMPATQWVIETLGCEDAINPRVKITNREYAYRIAFEGQLYKAGKDTVYFINHNWNETNINNQAPWDRFSCQDTIMFVAVKKEVDAKKGYLTLAEKDIIDQSFKLKHFSDYGDQYLKALVGTKDTLLNVAKDGSNFELVLWEAWSDSIEYGKVLKDADDKEIVSQLHRGVYLLKVKDFDKINNDQRFVGITKEGNYCVIDTIDAKTELAYPAYFYLKENDHKDDNHGYALVNANGGFDASGVRVGYIWDGADKLFVENKSSMAKKGLLSERQTDVFFMVKDTMPYYKRMAVSAQDTVSFYDAANSRRVLIEDHNSVYSNNKGAGFLGFRSLDEAPALKAAPSMYVDTAYVRNDTRMPLYLLAVGAQHKATKACDHAFDLANPGHSAHFGSRPYIQGRYLVDLSNNSLVDSIPYIKAKDAVHEGIYTRQAFVNAIHMGDSVYILKDTLSTYEYEDSIKHYAVATLPISAETYNGATVSFRLKDQDNDENFYIEMNGKFAGFAANGGAWIKNQNNVSVLATASNEYYLDHNGDMVSFAQEDIYQGTVFTMKKSTENPTDNEVIETSEVSVIGGTGNVQIAGAEGKRVTISNILGQAIANTVISSSDAIIAVPAGIVVVAVEGEAAVKAIIK